MADHRTPPRPRPVTARVRTLVRRTLTVLHLPRHLPFVLYAGATLAAMSYVGVMMWRVTA